MLAVRGGHIACAKQLTARGLDPLCKTVNGFWFTCAADKAMKCRREGENWLESELETRSEAQTSPPTMMAAHASMTRELLKVIEEYL